MQATSFRCRVAQVQPLAVHAKILVPQSETWPRNPIGLTGLLAPDPCEPGRLWFEPGRLWFVSGSEMGGAPRVGCGSDEKASGAHEEGIAGGAWRRGVVYAGWSGN